MSQMKVSNQNEMARADSQADWEVVVRAQRRQFSVAEKARKKSKSQHKWFDKHEYR